MKETIKHILHDKIIFWSLCVSVILFLALVTYILVYYSQLPPLLPLYNRMPWGYNRLGSKLELFLPLGISFVFVVINCFVITKMYAKNVFVSRMLGAVSFTLILCVAVYFLKITQLVL